MNSRVRTMAPAQVSEPTLEFGRRLAAALLGVDALYRAESGDRDGLVVLNLDTAGEIPAETFASWAEARRRLTDLRQAAASLPERDRRVYYDQACSSTLAFVAWRDGGLPFTDQLRTFLHVPAQAVTRTELDALQTQLHALLGRLGCEGDLARRCREWEQRQRVEPDEAAAVRRTCWTMRGTVRRRR
jgi:hypothetical protein